MTECLLDRTPQPLDAMLETWGELLETLDDGLGAARRVVTAVRFEGVDQPSYRADGVRARTLAGLTRVEVETAATGEILHDSILMGRESVAVLAASAVEVADRFRGVDFVEAQARLAELVEAIRHLTVLTAAVAEVGRFDLNALACGRLSAADTVGQVGAGLQILLASQQAQDWVAVADCLEFDLAPAIDGWSTVFDAIEREEHRKTHGDTR
jgi:hypothetical protein